MICDNDMWICIECYAAVQQFMEPHLRAHPHGRKYSRRFGKLVRPQQLLFHGPPTPIVDALGEMGYVYRSASLMATGVCVFGQREPLLQEDAG